MAAHHVPNFRRHVSVFGLCERDLGYEFFYQSRVQSISLARGNAAIDEMRRTRDRLCAVKLRRRSLATSTGSITPVAAIHIWAASAPWLLKVPVGFPVQSPMLPIDTASRTYRISIEFAADQDEL